MKLLLFVLLLCPAMMAQVPNAPSFTPRSNKQVMKDWKFWVSNGADIGATLFDEQATLDGLQRGRCVENSFENPHPTRGDLVKKDFPIIAGVIGVKYLFMRAGLPWPSWITMDGAVVFKHTRGGYRWMLHC